MKNSKKRGFTIVELVIVIAVIAILAGVLIPTFVSVIKKGQEANDTALIKYLNTSLTAGTIGGKTPDTMQDALDIVEADGYNVAKIKATASGARILWDSKNNCFVYLKDGETEPTYIPDSKNVPANNVDYWQITEADEDLSGKYSNYLALGYSKDLTNVQTGLDVGQNTGIAAITLETTADTTLVVRTNSSATALTVKAPNATVKHFEAVGTVKVVAVDRVASYHEFGQANTVIVNDGHIVVESAATVANIIVEKSTASDAEVSVDNKGEVATVAGADSTVTISGVATENQVAMTNTLTNVGGYVKLTADQVINDSIVFSAKTVLDLNGFKITVEDSKCLTVESAFTVFDSSASQNGSIEKNINKAAPLFIVKNGGLLTLNSGTLLTGSSYVTDSTSYKQTVDVYDKGTLVVNGGTIHSLKVGTNAVDYTGAAIGAWNTCYVYVNGGTIVSDCGFAIAGNGGTGAGGTTVTVNGGSIIGGDVAIYNPQYGVLNINGGMIQASTCVYVKSGSLTVSGGTFNAIGEKSEFSHSGNGCGSTGDCIVIESCNYPGGTPMAYVINGAKFSSKNGKYIVGYVYQNNAEIVITSDLAFEIVHVN